MHIEVLITSLSEDRIQVRWTARLDGTLTGVRRDIEAAIDDLDGVEQVTMTRYRALVQVVPDVVPLPSIVQELEQLFKEKSPLLKAPSVLLNRISFTVTSVPV